MSNMSYCRFHNTVSDLIDCIDHLEDPDLSDEEAKKRFQLIEVMTNAIERYDLMDEDSFSSFSPKCSNYRFKKDDKEDDDE